MNSEHSVDVDELIKKYNEQWEQLKAIALLYNHQVEQIKNTECCGNCNMKDCDTERGNLDYNFNKYCDKWQSDGLKREERMFK